MMPADPWRIGLAAVPLAALLAGLLVLRWSAVRAAAVALAVTSLLAGAVYRTPPAGLVAALARAAVTSLHVLYIIWAALLLYEIADRVGAIASIGEEVSRLTEDHVLQLLIVGFAFSSFLQGVAGFGVPVAVTAPLLLGLGFAPLEAAAAPLVGHAWAVTMGDMASSFQALRAVTGLPARALGVWTAALLGGVAVATGFAVAHVHAGPRPFRRALGAIAILGAVMGVVQLLLALAQHWVVASFGAGMVGLVVGVAVARLARRRGPAWLGTLPAWPPPYPRDERPRSVHAGRAAMGFHEAFLPYYTLIGVVGTATFVPPVRRTLESVILTAHFVAVPTGLGWPGEGGEVHFPPLAHPGALLLYASGLTVVLYRLRGRTVAGWRRLWAAVVRQGAPTSAAVLLLVGMATLMGASGMTFLLAQGLVTLVGPAFPLLSPLLGLLGTVITGSNTNSNVLFGSLQRDAARLLGMDPVLMAALQTAGGSVGSMVAPAKVVLATAAVGLSGQEGRVMRLTARYALPMTVALGLVGWALQVAR